ncbi:hypothetical protein J6590_022645 [Homalodisca vitripennis]|nr:hypothetical protein J6590_022645 [Homalodisca vitripennis]
MFGQNKTFTTSKRLTVLQFLTVKITNDVVVVFYGTGWKQLYKMNQQQRNSARKRIVKLATPGLQLRADVMDRLTLAA